MPTSSFNKDFELSKENLEKLNKIFPDTCESCKWFDINNQFWNCLHPEGSKRLSETCCENWEEISE